MGEAWGLGEDKHSGCKMKIRTWRGERDNSCWIGKRANPDGFAAFTENQKTSLPETKKHSRDVTRQSHKKERKRKNKLSEFHRTQLNFYATLFFLSSCEKS